MKGSWVDEIAGQCVAERDYARNEAIDAVVIPPGFAGHDGNIDEAGAV